MVCLFHLLRESKTRQQSFRVRGERFFLKGPEGLLFPHLVDIQGELPNEVVETSTNMLKTLERDMQVEQD